MSFSPCNPQASDPPTARLNLGAFFADFSATAAYFETGYGEKAPQQSCSWPSQTVGSVVFVGDRLFRQGLNSPSILFSVSLFEIEVNFATVPASTVVLKIDVDALGPLTHGDVIKGGTPLRDAVVVGQQYHPN